MSLVWYTNLEIAEGAVVDTNDYCDLNRKVLSKASRVEREVEALLEQIRKQEFPGAPKRICSILAVPWHGPTQQEIQAGRKQDVQEPAGYGEHCYRVVPGGKVQLWMVDEVFTDRLWAGWAGLMERDKLDLARAFWAGRVRRSYSTLLSGEVKVVSRCFQPTFRA